SPVPRARGDSAPLAFHGFLQRPAGYSYTPPRNGCPGPMQGAPAFSRTIYRPRGGAACYRIPQRASRAASTDRAAEQEARRGEEHWAPPPSSRGRGGLPVHVERALGQDLQVPSHRIVDGDVFLSQQLKRGAVRHAKRAVSTNLPRQPPTIVRVCD